MSAPRLYDPHVSTPVSRRQLQRAGILEVEERLQKHGYTGRIYILDTDGFTDEGLERFADDLIKDGQLLQLPVIPHPMEPQQCHRNVRDLIVRNVRDVGGLIIRPMPLLQEWTGLTYNVHDQGWIHHSWGVNHGKIIETTTRRDAYYGYPTLYEQYCRQVAAPKGRGISAQVTWLKMLLARHGTLTGRKSRHDRAVSQCSTKFRSSFQ